MRYCVSHCKVSCIVHDFDIKFMWVSDDMDKFNRSFLTIEMDKNTPVIVYQTMPKMTLFYLFYEFGSIISLWFGFSMNSLFELFLLLVLISKNTYKQFK